MNKLNRKPRDLFLIAFLPLILFPCLCFPYLYLINESEDFYNASICCYFYIVVGSVGAGIVSALIYARREQTKYAWRHFAQSHNLTFGWGTFWGGGASVKGDYNGYQLTLKTIRKEMTYTQFSLGAAQPAVIAVDEPQPEPEYADPVASLQFVVPQTLTEPITTEANGQGLHYAQREIITASTTLENIFNILINILEIYPHIVALGGKSVAGLQEIMANPRQPLYQVASQLLADIETETTARLGQRYQHLLCTECLVRYAPVQTKISPLESITYYACPHCFESQVFFAGSVTAVLDQQNPAKLWQDGEALHINWSIDRQLFDFDAISIINATDEDVERFAVQLGNDTDPIRQAKYPEMTCHVVPECQLSENTMRILKRTFGRVEMY